MTEKGGPRKGGSYLKDPKSGKVTLKERTKPPEPKKKAASKPAPRQGKEE